MPEPYIVCLPVHFRGILCFIYYYIGTVYNSVLVFSAKVMNFLPVGFGLVLKMGNS